MRPISAVACKLENLDLQYYLETRGRKLEESLNVYFPRESNH